MLKNGTMYEGTITYQDADKIQIQTSSGLEVIYKITIRRMTFGERKPESAEDKALAEKASEARAREEKEKKDRLAREAAAAERRAREEAEQKRIKEESDLRRQNAALRQELEALRESQRRREQTALDNQERSGWPSIWRSLLVPGWGQFYRGDVVSARVFATGALISTYYLYEANRRYVDARSLYSDASRAAVFVVPTRSSEGISAGFLYANQQRNLLRTRAGNANIALGVVGALYLANVVEVLVHDQRSSPRAAETAGAVSAFASPSQQLSFGMSIPF